MLPVESRTFSMPLEVLGIQCSIFLNTHRHPWVMWSTAHWPPSLFRFIQIPIIGWVSLGTEVSLCFHSSACWEWIVCHGSGFIIGYKQHADICWWSPPQIATEASVYQVKNMMWADGWLMTDSVAVETVVLSYGLQYNAWLVEIPGVLTVSTQKTDKHKIKRIRWNCFCIISVGVREKEKICLAELLLGGKS